MQPGPDSCGPHNPLATEFVKLLAGGLQSEFQQAPSRRAAGPGRAADDWIKSRCDMKSDAVKDLPSGKRVHHELEPLTIEYHGKTHLNKIDGRFQVRKL